MFTKNCMNPLNGRPKPLGTVNGTNWIEELDKSSKKGAR